MFSEISAFKSNPQIAPNQYEYYLFFPALEIDSAVIEIEKHVFLAVYLYWLPFFLFASCVYLMICYILVSIVTRQMVRPIKQLRDRILESVNRIRKFEKKQDDRHHSHDLLEMSKLYRGLQIELLRDYAAQSKEMNMLYF